MYTHILIATDGSELARKGVQHGLSLARRLGARATIVNVGEPTGSHIFVGEEASTASIADIQRQRQRQLEASAAILAKVKQEAEAMGVPAETVYVEDMRPAQAIVDAARQRDCTLIVMASHGRRGLGRLLLGSQATDVLAHSHIPVLVVR